MTKQDRQRAKQILFNAPMVQALLDGRKTQTRWPIKELNNDWRFCETSKPFHKNGFVFQSTITHWHSREMKSKYEVGDILYVRETWADVNTEHGPAIAYKDGAIQTWEEFSTTFGPDEGAGPSMDYATYPGNYIMWADDLFAGEEGHAWRHSIHMPKWAARIFLKVTGVRVEKLQDITERGAMSEGFIVDEGYTARLQFLDCWYDVYKKKKFIDIRNQWVWVYDLERIT